MQVEPYLFFEGRCDEALDFYCKAIGAEVTALMRYKESPDPAMSQHDMGDKVMHANLRIGEATIMASDGMCDGNSTFKGFALTISLKDQSEAEQYFAALSDGGQVQMPLAKTFFSPCFGMVTDRFGVSWMIIVME